MTKRWAASVLVLASAAACEREAPAQAPPAPRPAMAPRVPATAAALARTFAPELVSTLAPTTPTAGAYAMALDMSYDTFVTTELHLEDRRTGALTLTLGADGSAHACAAARSQHVADGQREYVAPNKPHGHVKTDDARVAAFAGTWTIADGVALIHFDHVAWSTCDDSGAQPTTPTDLRCVGFGATPLVPSPGLACEMSANGDLLELGMPMTSASHVAPDEPMHAVPSGRQLILGAPGLAVKVAQDSHVHVPAITFAAAAAVAIDVAHYLPAPPPPAKP